MINLEEARGVAWDAAKTAQTKGFHYLRVLDIAANTIRDLCEEVERLRGREREIEAAMIGYMEGRDDTTEGRCADPLEAAQEICKKVDWRGGHD